MFSSKFYDFGWVLFLSPKRTEAAPCPKSRGYEMLGSHVNLKTLDFRELVAGAVAGAGAGGVVQKQGVFRSFLNGFWVGVWRHSGYGSQRRVGGKKLLDFWEALITSPVFAEKDFWLLCGGRYVPFSSQGKKGGGSLFFSQPGTK